MGAELRYAAPELRIYDASWSHVRPGTAPFLVDKNSLAFVRSGILQVGEDRDCLIDANQFLATQQPLICSPAGSQDGGCSIFAFEDRAFRPLPLARNSFATPLSTAALFMRHWHVFGWAQSCPEQTYTDAMLLLREVAQGADFTYSNRATNGSAIVAAIKTAMDGIGVLPLRLHELAQALEMSPFTVSRMFHREVGISIREYGKRLRLRRAMELILQSSTDFGAIAVDLGFFDQAHFSNAFRQHFGIAASMVRHYLGRMPRPPVF